MCIFVEKDMSSFKVLVFSILPRKDRRDLPRKIIVNKNNNILNSNKHDSSSNRFNNLFKS